MTSSQALRYVDRIAAWPVAILDYRAIRSAMELSAANRLLFCHARVVVAAAQSGADRLYTENLQHGQIILGVKVVNPFTIAPSPG